MISEVCEVTEEQRYKINEFFVHVFNQILAWEGQTIKKAHLADVSVRELHIMDAVECLSKDAQNTMANIAKFLSVTPGALTTSVNTLVKKGYLERYYTKEDRRIVFVKLTEKGSKANEIHTEYHNQMVDAVSSALDKEELEVLMKSLDKLGKFFKSKIKE